MYPTITDLLKDLFGINIPLPIQSFGFMMAIAFIFAALTLYWELQRKEKQGILQVQKKKFLKGAPAKISELITNGLIGFVLGWKFIGVLFNYTGFTNNPQDYLLSSQGSIIGGLLVAGIAIYTKYRSAQKEKLDKPIWSEELIHPKDLTGNFTGIAAIAGILGSKLFHNLENMDSFIADPIGELFSFSGLTFYGGLILAGISIIYYARKNGIGMWHICDATAPGLILSYGIGRIGCHIAGDGDWGITNLTPKPEWLSFLPDWAWAYNYPHNVLSEGVPIANCVGKHCNMLELPVFPTPLYEVFMCIGIFFFLWWLRKKINVPGLLFSVYLLLNGMERFLIEKIRVNTQYHIFGYGITQAQIISFTLIILGIAGIYYFKFYKKKTSDNL